MKALMLALLVLLAGCGTSPPTHLFQLEPVAGATQAGAERMPPLAVNAFHLPPILDRLDIVQRAPGDAVVVSPTDRWAAPLDQMARRVLAQDLAARLGQDRVIQPDAPRPKGPTLGLVVVLEEFNAGPSGDVTLDGEWVLLAGSPGDPILRQHEHLVIGGGNRNQAVVMSDALGQLADRIAARITSGPLPGGRGGAA